ncbi:MAG: hypothetical protein FJ009_06685 [Chloroflexi bacterium]|nr:hypothetical protein [Chloroflexota bacterium]
MCARLGKRGVEVAREYAWTRIADQIEAMSAARQIGSSRLRAHNPLKRACARLAVGSIQHRAARDQQTRQVSANLTGLFTRQCAYPRSRRIHPMARTIHARAVAAFTPGACNAARKYFSSRHLTAA